MMTCCPTFYNLLFVTSFCCEDLEAMRAQGARAFTFEEASAPKGW